MLHRKAVHMLSWKANKKRESLAGEIRSEYLKEARTNATYYPRIRTKELYKSILWIQKHEPSKLAITLQAGNDVAYYAIFVEEGTSRMAPRRYLQRAFDKVNQTVPGKILKYMRAYLEDPKYYG